MVREFALAFGQTVLDKPGYPGHEVALLRLQLIQEELSELTHAFAAGDLVKALDGLCDLQYVLDGTYLAFGLADMKKDIPRQGTTTDKPTFPSLSNRIELIARCQMELAGISLGMVAYVDHDLLVDSLNNFQRALNDCFLYCGCYHIKNNAVVEVHRSNMTKLGPDGKPIINAAGRVMKPEGYSKPDLERFLK